MNPEKYTNIIIGSGEGGKYLAWHLAQSGEKTVVIDRRWIGGSCPNVNCLPSKNEIWSAKVADLVHHGDQFGVAATKGPSHMALVRKRKREMVDGLIAMHLERYQASGAELVMGEAKFVDSRMVEVNLNDGGTRRLTPERIFLNLGTRASIPAVPGLAESEPLTNIELLELDRLPEHLVVIGGGYVGLEFAQAYRRFGSRVTILAHGAQLLSNQDPDVVTALLEAFASEGICVIAPVEIVRVSGRSGESVKLTLHFRARTTDTNERVRYEPSYGEKTIACSDMLVATGRAPNTAGIGLELAGVEVDERGYIKVNERLETTARNIWAIGECAGSPKFTHICFDDFRVIRDNLAGGNRTTRDRIVPSCLFTDPQVAHVGLTEKEAAQRGLPVRVAKLPMAAVLRARTTDETRGFAKALIANDDRIVGFTMIGPEASEVLAVVQMAMLAELPYTALRDAIITHPTMAEGLNALFSRVERTELAVGQIPSVSARGGIASTPAARANSQE